MSVSLPGWCLLAAVLVALAALAPARAQEIGSHIKTFEPANVPDSIHLTDLDRARMTFDAYTACLMQRSARALKSALNLAVDDPAYKRTVENLAVEDCLRAGELKFPVGMMRGGFYVALYRRDFARKNPPLGNAPLFPYSDFANSGSPAVREHDRLIAFADCAVHKDPAASRALVLGPTASKQELAAFTVLSPSLMACTPRDGSVHFFKPMLYGLIAEALYRESVAAVPSAEIAKVVH